MGRRFRGGAVVGVGALLIASGAAGQAREPVVIDGARLAAWAAGPERGRLVILHAARERAGYDSARIGGARFVRLSSFAVSRGGLPTELPPVPVLDTLLRGLGITDSSRIVVYGEPLAAARLFFTLDYLGLGDRTHWLDGGVAAARGAMGPAPRGAGQRARMRAGQGPGGDNAPPPAGLTLRPREELVVPAGWVRSRLADPGVALVDARTSEEFAGIRAEEGAWPGHIPGAVNLDWQGFLRDGRLKPPAELRAMFREAGVKDDREVVAYCRVGTRASFLYLVSRILGYPTRMYDGSMAEWAASGDLPVAR